jgi:hypothetical protein
LSEEVEPRTAAMGYFFALRRFDEAAGRAYGRDRDLALFRDRLFVSLIESLTWLEMLFDHDDTRGLIEADMRGALRFARGRSRHAWAEAIEFRTDVPLQPSLRPRAAATGKGSRIGPAVIADWCWRPAAELPGGKRPGSTVGKAEYERLFAGRRAREVLEGFVEIANRIASEL